MRLTNLLPARYLFIQPAALILTGAILIPFISIPAPAQPATPAPGNVLKGKDAFGDWRADAPGVRRLFTPDDVQPANPQPLGKEEGNFAQVVARPVGAQPLVPAGFNVEMIASGLAMPRVIRAAPNGDLFLAESGAGEIRVFHFSSGSAMPSPSRVFASGLHKPYGIAFYPPGPDPKWVYIANTDSVVRFAYRNGDIRAYAKPETIISPIIWTHHWTRDIVFTPDGARMLLAVGSGSNVALDMFPMPFEPGGLEAWKRNQPLGAAWDTEERRAQILSYEPNGKFDKSIATGLRNPAGMTIQPATGQLWAVINERDGLGDDVPFEYATAVKEGAFYGWPWYYDGSTEEPRHRGARTDLKDKVTLGDVLIQPHSAPLQIVFYEGKNFPADYQGDAFVTLHGSWNRSNRTGYKVIRLKFHDGKPTGEYEDFMTGMVVSDKAVWGRPVGVAVAKDGALYVSEDGNGTIWRISRQANP